MNNNLSTKTYFQNLDGLRFWAFFAVFLAHSKFVFSFPFDRTYWFWNTIYRFMSLGDMGV